MTTTEPTGGLPPVSQSGLGPAGRVVVVAAWALGAAGAAYGLVLVLQQGLSDLVDIVIWLAGGVVLHDFVLVPITLTLLFLGSRLVPDRLRGPVAAGLVVLGTVTVVAIPVLGRFGARPDNPTLLDRNYAAGWLAVAALTVIGVVVTSLVTRRRGRRTRGHSARRR